MHVHDTHGQWIRCSLVASLLWVSSLAGCAIPGTGDDTPFNDVMAIDTRPYVQTADVSGLPAGDHKLSFEVYVQKGRTWNEGYAQRLRDAVRVRKLRPFLGDVKAQVEIDAIQGKSDRTLLTVTLPLGEDETWAMYLRGSGVVVAEPGRKEAFDFDHPESLPSFDQLVASVFLRTSGYCPHPVEGTYHGGAGGELVGFEVRLSEPLKAPFDKRLPANDVDGAQLGTAFAATTKDGAGLLIGPPEKKPAISGMMTVTLPTEVGIAGGFAEGFTCSPAAFAMSVDVGGMPGVQVQDGQRVGLSPSIGQVEYFGVPK